MKKIKIDKKKTILNTVISMLAIGLSFLLDKAAINIASMIQYPFLATSFYLLTMLGEWYVFMWIALFLTVILMINRKPIAAFIATLAVTTGMSVLLKAIINRPRPFQALHTSSVIDAGSSSFPSGHAMIFFCMIPLMSKNFPKTKILFWIVAILVALSRVYFNVHYLSDVVAGAICGYAIGWIFMNVGERYEWKY